MISYNHNIQFIPELQNNEKRNDPSLNTLAIIEGTNSDLQKKLLFEQKFFSNQERDITLYTEQEFSRTTEGQLWIYDIKNVVTFYWYSGTWHLKYIKQNEYSDDLLKYWSLQAAIPLFFTIEETYTFLHAGAVEVGGKLILFVAESFGGKSTMTDFFMTQGHKMLSDDRVGIYEKNGQIFAVPSHPYHRPYRKMEDLGHFVENMVLKPIPVHAVYSLKAAKPNDNVKIEELSGLEKFKIFRSYTQMNFSFLKTKYFALMGRLADVIPIYSVTVPWDLKRLPEVHEYISKHSEKIGFDKIDQ